MNRKHQTMVIALLGLLGALVNPLPAQGATPVQQGSKPVPPSASPQSGQRIAPKVEVMDLGLASVGLSGAKVLLVLKVENPNPEPLTVDVIFYQLQLNQLEPLRGRIAQRETFPAAGTRRVRVPVELPYGAYLPAILALIQEPEGARYRISGKVKLKDELEMIDFEHEGRLENLNGSKPAVSTGGRPVK